MTAIDFLKGKWLGHPLHPAVVHIPVGLWPAALIFDLLSRIGSGNNALVQLSFFCIAIGMLAILPAIPSGLADWSEIKKEKPAWKIGLWHMILNLFATVFFAINLGLRAGEFRTATTVETPALLLSALGVVILAVSAYLGGLMVFDHGINVARQSKKKWRKIAERGGANLPADKEKKA